MPETERLRQTAEARYLPSTSSALAGAVRAQPWFEAMTQEHLHLVAALQRSERSARARGEEASIVPLLDYAASQSWFGEGLGDYEAKQLRGVFHAYAASLENPRAPRIGPLLLTTLRYGLIEVVTLPESGDVFLLVSSLDEWLGQEALWLALEALPLIEEVVGPFPYDFLHIQVTELPELYAGLSYDEYIALAPDYVDAPTVIHEITHSTLYGIFPLWFEEGFAHFLEHYLTGSLHEGEAYFRAQLAYLGADEWIDLRARQGSGLAGEMIDRAQGFLFVQGLYEVGGMETLAATIRGLRTRTFNHQDLIRALVRNAEPHEQADMREYMCHAVRGTTHNYCAAQ